MNYIESRQYMMKPCSSSMNMLSSKLSKTSKLSNNTKGYQDMKHHEFIGDYLLINDTEGILWICWNEGSITEWKS